MPGLVLFRFDAPLFFANAEVFRHAEQDALARSRDRCARWCSGPSRSPIDTTAADVLAELHVELAARGSAPVRRAEGACEGRAASATASSTRSDAIGSYLTLGQAVRAHVDAHGVEWRDWEDRRDAP